MLIFKHLLAYSTTISLRLLGRGLSTLVLNLLTKGLNASQIGIITAYRKQAEKIRVALSHVMGTSQTIKVGLVEDFQGDEKEVILISTVKSIGEEDSEYTKGFLKNPKMFNVAISRAKVSAVLFSRC